MIAPTYSHILIVSRNFNAGHLAHLLATYRLISDLGHAANLLIHPSFRRMLGDSVVESSTTLFDPKFAGRSRLMIVLFPSVRVLFDILLSRIIRKCRIVYVFHEPFDSVQSYLDAGFGKIKTFKIVLVAIVNYLIVLASSRVILPSDKAISFFRRRYLHTGKPYTRIPLLFDDLTKNASLFSHRECISYIGTVAADHAFDEFIQFIIMALDRKLFKNFKFLIATRSILPETLLQKIAQVDVDGRVELRHGQPLSIDEIGDCFRRSVVVWNAYKRSMQSGVLPMSYMFGTPLLVTETNRSEFFEAGKNGAEISSRYDFAEIVCGVEFIFQNFAACSARCRQDFLNIFYYRAQTQAFSDFVFDRGDL